MTLLDQQPTKDSAEAELVGANDQRQTTASLSTSGESANSGHSDTRKACYLSPEYQANTKVRQPHSVADLLIIEGCDGPQP